jgi:hypothetical protein
MSETGIALIFFVVLAAAALGAQRLHTRLPKRHRGNDTHAVVRLCAGVFVVTTSLILGLMINSAKNTFEGVDKAVHAYATELILLDRTLRSYGPEADAARRPLFAYVQQAVARMAQSDPVLGSRRAESFLVETSTALRALRPATAEQTALKERAERRFEKVYEMRWALIEQSEGTIPMPLILLLLSWLTLIFGSFGYRAPGNVVVTTSFVVSAALIAGAIYLILDMDVPFDGTIQVSPAPLVRAEAEMR